MTLYVLDRALFFWANIVLCWADGVGTRVLYHMHTTNQNSSFNES